MNSEDIVMIKTKNKKYTNVSIFELVLCKTSTELKNNIIMYYNLDILDLFKKCCLNGLIIEANWIYELYTTIVTKYIHENNDNIFSLVCKTNNMYVLEWLIDKIDIKQNEKKHLIAGINNLEVIQFLCRNGANIFIEDSILLIEACKVKNYKLIQWLIDMGINIRAYDDEAFRTACYCNNIKVSQILLNNCSNYSLFIRDNKTISWDIGETFIFNASKRRKLF